MPISTEIEPPSPTLLAEASQRSREHDSRMSELGDRRVSRSGGLTQFPRTPPFPALKASKTYSWERCWEMALQSSPYKGKRGEAKGIYNFVLKALKTEKLNSKRMWDRTELIKEYMAPVVEENSETGVEAGAPRELCFFEATDKDEEGVDKVLSPVLLSQGGVDLPHYTVFDLLGFLMAVASDGGKEKPDAEDHHFALLSLYCQWTRKLAWEFVGKQVENYEFDSLKTEVIPSMHSIMWTEKGSVVLGSTIPSGIVEPKQRKKKKVAGETSRGPDDSPKKPKKARYGAEADADTEVKNSRKSKTKTNGIIDEESPQNGKAKNSTGIKKSRKGREEVQTEENVSQQEAPGAQDGGPVNAAGGQGARPTFGKKDGRTKDTIQEDRAIKILTVSGQRGNTLDLQSIDAYPTKPGSEDRAVGQLFGHCAESNEFIWYPSGSKRKGGGIVGGLAMVPRAIAEETFVSDEYVRALRDPCVNCQRLLVKIVGGQKGVTDKAQQQTVLKHFGVEAWQNRREAELLSTKGMDSIKINDDEVE